MAFQDQRSVVNQWSDNMHFKKPKVLKFICEKSENLFSVSMKLENEQTGTRAIP